MLQVKCGPDLEQIHQPEQVRDFIRVLLDIFEQDLGQKDQLVFLADFLELTLFEFFLSIFNAMNELFFKVCCKCVHALQPSVIACSQFQNNFQESEVIFLRLGFIVVLIHFGFGGSELVKDLVNVLCVSGQFLSQGVRVIHLYDFKEVRKFKLPFMSFIEDIFSRNSLTHRIQHLSQNFFYVYVDCVLSKLGCEIIADRDHVFED